MTELDAPVFSLSFSFIYELVFGASTLVKGLGDVETFSYGFYNLRRPNKKLTVSELKAPQSAICQPWQTRKIRQRRFFHGLPASFGSIVVFPASSGRVSSRASPTLAS